ncbi:toll/interleukin-1 receptor domain-containing protein [Actinoplanes sp. Pm04-4]|uniref:Toll/interleukin-1 receptor domain-containing protein n=1 Tax=Paractinoplanes pyxinae TaxID=2997416 RepID=A0ABT4B3D8_9ACTN|nr:toll/interleukin-1 receptor domain-containing protein [Actinoplanes pyxinae]MCY1141001.1 toll/interleukin-1 receptor domain-containing protein [Actinoplanes pyxinae]
MGSVQLVHGDMFTRPCDLIVLPCSTVGSATRFVAQRLREHDIAWPTPAQLGTVKISRFDGAQNLAQQVAWATSVKGGGSDLRMIEKIGRRLGEATTEAPYPQKIAAPLLGTGAGHLAPEDVLDRLTAGFLATASREATLRIFVLARETYDDLVRHRDGLPASDQPSPAVRKALPDARDREAQRVHTSAEPVRVFISYTADTPAVKTWVRDLGAFLRASGVNARLDIWHLMVGMNLQQWMQNEITQADRVVLVCTEAYAKRADDLDGGLAYEIKQIQEDIGAKNEQLKYLPLVWSADVTKALPIFLKPYLYVHWPPTGDDTEARRRLLEAILSRQEEAPPIGAYI